MVEMQMREAIRMITTALSQYSPSRLPHPCEDMQHVNSLIQLVMIMINWRYRHFQLSFSVEP